MVFQRNRGAMMKVQQNQAPQRNPKTEMKFEDSDDDEDDEDESGDDDVDAGSDQEETSKSKNDESDEDEDEDDMEDDDDEEDDDDDEGEEKVVSKNSKAGNQQKQKIEFTGKQKQVLQKQQQKGSLLKIASTPMQKSILSTPATKKQMPDSAQNKRKSTDSALPESKRPKLNFLAEDEVAIEERRQKERDKRSLFVAQIPVNVTEDDVRALSNDIVDVRIPIKRRAQQMQPYAFVEFLSEAKAEENYTKLGNMKLSGQKFIVDFVGEKSKNQQKSKTDNVQNKTVNKVKLYVSGIPSDCKLADVSKLFPTSGSITLEPHKEGPKRFAYVTFDDEDAAKTVFKKADNLKLNGRPLTVLYAAEHARKKLKNKKKGKKQKKPQKKVAEKANIKEEEASDDDDDDDDEEDDDEDD